MSGFRALSFKLMMVSGDICDRRLMSLPWRDFPLAHLWSLKNVGLTQAEWLVCEDGFVRPEISRCFTGFTPVKGHKCHGP